MKFGNIIVYLIAGIVLGGLVGCVVGNFIPHTSLSDATGVGCGIGLLAGGVFGATRRFA